MNDMVELSRHTYVPTKCLEFASIYYKHMQCISEQMAPDERRIGLLATLFSISTALIEINDLPHTPIKFGDVVTRVLDTLFRGQRDEVDTCLKAMGSAGLVTISAEKRRKSLKKTCTFTPKYVDIMRAYTEEMCLSITNVRLNLGNYYWTPIAQAIFDYFAFRYTPEWFLFLRRVLRSSGLPEEEKEELYDQIFSSARIWRSVNRYFDWAHRQPPQERTRLEFQDYLGKIPALGTEEPAEAIRYLTKIGICEISNNLFIIHHKLEDDLADFEQNTLRDYESFADTIHAMVAKFQQPGVGAALVA